MKSRVSTACAAIVLIAAQAPEPADPSSPRATAGDGATAAYDTVGYARIGDEAAMTAAHPRLPAGSIAEVTALDTGRITLVQVAGRPDGAFDGEIELSRTAAQALALRGDMDAVRVRSIRASSADIAALRAGGVAAPRLPAPDALLRGLRRMVPALPAGDAMSLAATAPRTLAQRAPAPLSSDLSSAPKRVGSTRGGLLVQVAAVRDERHARDAALLLHGRVEAAGGWWRVRLGPFADRAAAQRARDAAISRGYGGATIIPAS